MKYFTRQLFDAMQTRDEAAFNEAKSKWDANSVSYREQLQQIRSTLPRSMQEFCGTSLHDGVVTTASIKPDSTVSLEIDASNNPWGPTGKFRLVFDGVHSLSVADDIVDDCWLYEEVHLHSNAAFEYCIMFEGTDFRVAADSFHVVELPV